MIVRILNEGQYRVDDGDLGALNACDARVEEALEADDQAGLTAALEALIAAVVEHGEQLSADDLHDSDLIVPDAGSTLAEIRTWLDDSGSEDGLIPG